MRKYLILLTVLLIMPISSTYAEIYSWTDRGGISHYSDDISKVPTEYQDQARAKKIPDSQEPAMEQGGNQPGPDSTPKYKKEKKAAKKGSYDPEDTDSSGRGEAYWHNRAESLRQRLKDLQEEYESLSSQEKECESKSYNAYGKKRMDCTSYQRYKERTNITIERTRRQLEVDLPDEARKAGAYPGWLR